jgi:hypothetical protein
MFGETGLRLDILRFAVNKVLVSIRRREKTASGKRRRRTGRRGKPGMRRKAEMRKWWKHGPVVELQPERGVNQRAGEGAQNRVGSQVKRRVFRNSETLVK